MADKKGIIYFRLNNPLYEGDTTKNCGLSGTEIDKNFNFLRGSDIASGAWDPERKILVLKRLNGEAISIDGINFDASFSLEGSSFSPESGGTLSLIVNGGEPYLITGMTESCSAATIVLENYVTNEKFEGLEEDVTELAEEYFRLSADIEEYKNSFNDSIARIREEVEQNFCEIRDFFNSHIAESNRKFQELDESVQNLTNSTENRFNQVNNRIYQALSNISARFSEIENSLSKIRERLDNIVLDGDVTALAQRVTYAEGNISGLSRDVQENKQDIDFLYTIMEKPGEIIEYPAVNAILAPSGAFEVGTYVNITQATYTFTTGRYEFGPETNISQIGSPRTGYTQNGVVNSEITVQDNTNLAFRVEIDYTEGASPNTSLGRQSTKPGIPAGTAVGVSNSVTGFRRIFFKSTSVTSNTFNESFVKLNANTVKATETSFNISIVGGNREIVIAVPSYRRVVSILDSNFNNTDIKANFTTTRCQIGGVSGRYPIEYVIYYYIPDAPFSVNNTYKVTIQ